MGRVLMPLLILKRLGAGMETYLTVNEVALLVKLSVQTIRRYTMRNEIPFHKINRAVRYKKSEIEFWVENRGAVKAQARCENLQGDLFGGTDGGAE
jgi:excisionase family DNA binding protein